MIIIRVSLSSQIAPVPTTNTKDGPRKFGNFSMAFKTQWFGIFERRGYEFASLIQDLSVAQNPDFLRLKVLNKNSPQD